MIMYNNGKIYKIVNDISDELYIGSTTYSLKDRMNGHISKWKSGSGTSSGLLFDKYGVDNCVIKLIESHACENKKQLCEREECWRNFFKTKCVNKIRCRAKKKVINQKERARLHNLKYHGGK